MLYSISCLFQEKASNLMDRADNAAQSAKESVQEVHIFLFNLMFYIFFREFILTTMAQWIVHKI
jgi:hypothetical protein